MMSNLKVAVRIRPLSEKEVERQSVSSVSIENGIVSVTNIKVPEHHAGDSRERIRKFSFDYCFNEDSSQDEVFEMVDGEISKSLSSRYHACVLAYGQSSTGKTYTMMGLQEEPGLTPRLCGNIFKYFQSSVTEEEQKHMRTSVSYLEIYNERVQDLLTSGNQGKSLKVREHPKKGPYVQGLTEHQVDDSSQLLSWLTTGNGNRRVAATANNRRSSRSHSVFTVTCVYNTRSCCRLHLVDLAGSERAQATNSGRITPRLKEGANINRSLVALGNVICALSDPSSKYSKNSRRRFVPYRDSVLTWLLKETLGGNSKTVMIATISPSSSCYSETVNTLRFSQRAKQIVNRPLVNEDAKEKLIRELRAEIVRLKELLMMQNGIKLSQTILPEFNETPELPSTSNDVTEVEQPPTPDPDEAETPVAASPIIFDPVQQEIQTTAKDLTESCSKLTNSILEEFIKPDDQKLAPVVEVKVSEDLENEVVSIDPSGGEESSTETDGDTKELLQIPPVHIKTDTLLPVINITSSVKPKVTKPTRLSRTASVEIPKSVVSRLRKDFGSHETLNNPNLKKTIWPRRLSTTTSTENLSKLGDISKLDTSSRSGSISESSGKSTPKHTPIQRDNHRRSEVVAAVTQRLYSQRREKSSDNFPLFPRPNICSTTRMRLQEFTQRALRANKRKVNSECQTEGVSTLRLKEKSTDVQDIGIVLKEMKNVEVEASIEVKNIGISCKVENYSNSIKLTRSCSCQTEEQPKTVSFTKYLQLQNPFTQPIYTSSVNINVSHNYPQSKEEISDDSLEDCNPQNLKYSPPDLISNHNSLDPKPEDKYPKFYFNENFATDNYQLCRAWTTTTSPLNESKSTQPLVQASEIRAQTEFNETCTILPDRKIIPVKPTLTYENFRNNKPKITVVKSRKPILKQYSSDDSDDQHKLPKHPDLQVLHNFMDEASTLMMKLKTVAAKIDQSQQPKTPKYTSPIDSKECYVQTFLPYHDATSQTSSKIIPMNPAAYLQVPEENKWDSILKSSCDKLEQCVRLVEHKSREDERKKFDSDCLHRFPQPFSSDTDWKYCGNDFSSLETTQSASDYGSLPRREGLFRRNTYRHYSPKAYMKQLVAMRKQIVETSRIDDLKLSEY